MSMRNRFLAAAAVLAVSGAAIAQEKAQFGRLATPEEIASWDITVEPSGTGLPHGSGTAKQGEAVYAAKCQACHGERGAGGAALQLAGIKGTVGAKDTTVKTIGTFWPYATTVFDYVFTSMPYQETKSLTHDETYAVTAYLLHLNGIIVETDVIDAQTLPKVRMPNRDYFIQHVTE
jgi:mono/diheme cytochrome c family protein